MTPGRWIGAACASLAFVHVASCSDRNPQDTRAETRPGTRPETVPAAPVKAPDLPVPLVAHGACVEQGRIWVTGTSERERRVFVSWAPPETAWRDEGAMPFAAVFHGMCALDGRLYAAGGLPKLSEAWEYDLAARAWRPLPPMPTPRSRMRAVAHGGLIYVIGGYIQGTAHDGNTGACEAYDPRAKTWTARAPMPTPRHGHTVVPFGGKLVVTGGGDSASARAEVYDPAKDAWTVFSDCPPVYRAESASPRGREAFNLLFHEAVEWGGRILHFGARDWDPIPVLAWDPGRDVWTVAAERGPLRHRMASARLGSTLFLIGGETSAREGPHAFRDVVAIDLRAFDRK